MRNRILASALTFLVGFSPLVAYAQKEVNKTFKDIKSIRITTASGDCKILKSNDASVSVSIRHGYDDRDFEPIMEQSGDRLEITEQFKARNVSGSQSKWTLTIPEGVAVRFKTGSGSMEVEEMKLQLDVNTGSGSVELRKVTGEVGINTGSGNVDLDRFNGEIIANVGSGSFTVVNSQGNLKLSCGSGNIRLSDSQAEFSANTGSGNVTGRNISLAGSSKFNTGSGDVMVGMATAPKHNLSVTSGSGDAELSFNGNEIVGEITMMADKAKGNIVAPFEFDKVEEISAWRDNITVKKTVVKGNSSPQVKITSGSGDAVIKK